MTTKKSYNRFFIIFQEEDKGYGVAIDKQPTGYAKIEVKSGKCKITVYAQNLKRERGPYFFYMIDTVRTPVLFIKLGELKIDEAGMGETWWEYNEENVADSKCSADKFNMASIIVPGESIIAPLAGYAGKEKIEWKEKITIEHKHDEHHGEHEKHKEHGEASEDCTRGSEEEVYNLGSTPEALDQEGLKFRLYEEEIRGGDVRQVEADSTNDIKIPETNTLYNNTRGEDEQVGDRELNLDEVKPFDSRAYNDDNPTDYEDSALNYSDDQRSQKEYKNKHKGYKAHAAIFHQMLSNFDEVKDIFDEDESIDCRWWRIPYNCSFPLMENKYYPFLCTIYHLKMTYPNIDYIKYFYRKGYYYFGMKYDTNNEVKYIMYGIEGTNSMKEQPYMGMTGFGKWKRLMGKNSGMWIMFYNPRTGNIMVERNE